MKTGRILAACLVISMASCGNVMAANKKSKPQPVATSFTTDAQWLHAGYDLGTTVYQIFITSQDAQILRCNTVLHAHAEAGGELSDQQTSTVFPGQRTQVGNWTGLDQDGETHYTTECKPI